MFSSLMSGTWNTDGRKMSLKLVDYILFSLLDQMVRTRTSVSGIIVSDVFEQNNPFLVLENIHFLPVENG